MKVMWHVLLQVHFIPRLNFLEKSSVNIVMLRESVMRTTNITLFRSITLFCGTDSFPHHIFHIKIECREYVVEYC